MLCSGMAAANQFVTHDRAVILSTGDELITGQLQDTNARWLSEQLMGVGIMPLRHEAVGDQLNELVSALRRAVSADPELGAPLVIMSGGLGPTDGDLTRAALACVTGNELVIDDAARAALAAMLARRGRELTARQERQATRPSSASCLPNPLGTAPGLHIQIPRPGGGHAEVFALPGPPGELRPMFEASVRPLLRPPPGLVVATRLLHIVGVPEADCVTRLGELTRRDRPANLPLIGITASGGILTLRIRYRGPGDLASAEASIDDAEAEARRVLGDHCFARGDAPGVDLLSREIIARLWRAGETIAVVESCTGGMLGELLTSGAGASSAFIGGFITYSNEQKVAIGVRRDSLSSHGAVSAVVAAEMARAGRDRTGASHCLAITGVAGPDGGSEAKPVGTVHIALDSAAPAGRSHNRHFLFSGDREDIRRRSAVNALTMLHFAMAGRAAGEPRLLWEVR